MKLARGASLMAALLSACGSVDDVYLGQVPNGGRGGGTGAGAGMASAGSSPSGEWICGGDACASHSGSRTVLTSTAPQDAPERFASAAQAGPELPAASWIYPNHQSRIPGNLGPIRFEWSATEADTLFQIRYSGQHTEVVVHTDATSYEPSPEIWEWIAESNIGSAVKVGLSALTTAGEKRSAPSLELDFGVPLPEGQVYYWSTAAQGVLRVPVTGRQPARVEPSGEAQLEIPTLEPPTMAEVDAAAANGACAGCHSLSRDGSRLAIDVGAGRLRVANTRDLRFTSPSTTAQNSGTGGAAPAPGKLDKAGSNSPAVWSTFSPDGAQVLAASAGKLQVFPLPDGEPPTQPSAVLTLPEKASASHPDWSPVGDQIAFALAEKGQGRSMEHAAIAVVDYLAEASEAAFGGPEILVPSTPMQDNNLFPAFSPDGRFIAFVTLNGNSEDSQRAIIRLLRLSDRKIFELERLNRRLAMQDSKLAFGNSMPTWAQSADGETTWLAFSSLRPYASLREMDSKREQIWLSAIDLGAAARAGPDEDVDPSWAAFWAPFQLLEHANHRAQFTPFSTAERCSCTEVCADQIDNDCNGSTDELPCRASCAAAERCDDGVDDDCDCVVDDCSAEACDDGLDNDGDGFADAADLSCAKP